MLARAVAAQAGVKLLLRLGLELRRDVRRPRRSPHSQAVQGSPQVRARGDLHRRARRDRRLAQRWRRRRHQRARAGTQPASGGLRRISSERTGDRDRRFPTASTSSTTRCFDPAASIARSFVALPDSDGREAILLAHAKGKPLGPDVDLRDVARKTTGMTGAQLANALNEGAMTPVAPVAAMAREDLDEALLRQSVGSQQARRLNARSGGSSLLARPATRSCAKLLGLDPPGCSTSSRAARRWIHRPLAAGGQLPEVARRAAQGDRHPARRQGGGGRGVRHLVLGRRQAASLVHAVCKQMVGEFGMGVALDAEGAPPIALPSGDYALSNRTRQRRRRGGDEC